MTEYPHCNPNSNETACFDGRGTCGNDGRCICTDGYVQNSELFDFTSCSVHVTSARILNGLAAGVWCIGFLLAVTEVLLLRRRDINEQAHERRLSFMVVAFTLLYSVALMLIVTAQPYGSRTLGNDVLVTICYSFAMATAWAFAIIKPVISRSGLSSSLFTYLLQGKLVYNRLLPLTVVASCTVSLLPCLLLSGGSLNRQAIIQSHFILTAAIVLVLSTFVVFALRNVQRNIQSALSEANQDLGNFQRQRLLRFHRRSNILLIVSTVNALVGIGVYLVLGSSYDIASRYTWVVYPIVATSVGLWFWRHSIGSIHLSRSTRAREFQTSTMDGEDDGNKDNDEQPGRFAATSRSVSPFASGKRHRRLRGVKRKPLELMTAVSERTAEGTVQFTHVDGLDVIDGEGTLICEPGRLEPTMEMPGNEERASSSHGAVSPRSQVRD